MKSEILFLAMYPYGEDAKDGLAQRILLIDKHFTDVHRTYIRISFRRFFKKKIVEHDNIYSIRCNFFAHPYLIFKSIKQNQTIYIHSIYNFFLVIHFLLLYTPKKLFLDAHGLVPEELKMEGQIFKAKLYSKVERIAFQKISGLVCVTNAMQQHFVAKYPFYKGKKIVYEMLTSITNTKNETKENFTSLSVLIIYSGNMQTWQNIDLMLCTIKKNLHKNIQYIILTGEPHKMSRVLQEYDLQNEKSILIMSVLPEALPQYYGAASYGFILRDDNIVNRVACPTKMIEYLAFGMIPIVKSHTIGDFADLGYEYVKYTDDLKELKPIKSWRNQQTIKKLYQINSSKNIKEFVFNAE